MEFYDSDHDCGEDMFIEENLQEAKPLVCWGRGLPKPKLSEIHIYKFLSQFTLKEKETVYKKPGGRGRGASYTSKTLSQVIVDGRIYPEKEEVSSQHPQQFENADDKDSLPNDHDPCRQEDFSERNTSSDTENDTLSVQLEKCENENSKNSISNNFVSYQETNVEENISSIHLQHADNENRLSSNIDSKNLGDFTEPNAEEPCQRSVFTASNINENELSLNRLQLNKCDNADKDNRSNYRDPCQCSDNIPESNYLESDKKNSPRLSNISVSSNESISSMGSSKLSEQESKTTTSHSSEMILADEFSDSSNTGACGDLERKCDNRNIREERTVHKKPKAKRNEQFTKMKENRKSVACIEKTNAEDACTDNTVAGSSGKRYSKTSIYKRKDILKQYSNEIKDVLNERKELNARHTETSVSNIPVPYYHSGSEDSSMESAYDADLGEGHRWGSINFNKTPTKDHRKPKWVAGDFPSLGSDCAGVSSSAVSDGKTPHKKKMEGLNLKSLGESLLEGVLDPISNSSCSSSGSADSPIPTYLQHLAADKSYYTIKFAVENIPGFQEEHSVRGVLELYGGIIVDLKLNACGDSLTAHVTMTSNSELKGIIEHLDGTSPFGASSKNLKVYLL